jgi:hypothetical protein
MSNANLTVEKRRTPRVIVAIPVRFKVINQAVDQPKEQKALETLNLSKGGVGLFCLEPLNKGDLLKVEIGVPGATKPLKTFAEVKWCRKMEAEKHRDQYRAGISFMAFRHEDDKLLDEYIGRVLSLAGK